MRLRLVIISALAVVFLAKSAHAQEAAGTISGSVADASGAVVADAEIEARNRNTSSTRLTTSDSRGQFTIPALQPGVYDLSVSRAGFKKALINAVELQVNQVLTVNAVLELGAVTEAVTVQAAVSALQLENTTVGAVIETRKINELPLNGRQFLQLTTLVPGTSSVYSRGGSRQGGRRSSVN